MGDYPPKAVQAVEEKRKECAEASMKGAVVGGGRHDDLR